MHSFSIGRILCIDLNLRISNFQKKNLDREQLTENCSILIPEIRIQYRSKSFICRKFHKNVARL